MGLAEYLGDPWNCIDVLSLLFVAVTAVRVLAGAESDITALFSAVGTLLLWVNSTFLYCMALSSPIPTLVGIGSAIFSLPPRALVSNAQS